MELVEKYDNKRLPLGKIVERYHDKPGEYGQGVHVWIMNNKGEFLVQKRSEMKKVHPGIWSVTGGGKDAGETTLQTVIRECKEELNIDVDIDNLELMLTVKRCNDFLDVWLLKQDINIQDIVMQEEEVSDVKWLWLDEIKEKINNREMAPNLKLYFDLFEDLLNKKFEF